MECKKCGASEDNLFVDEDLIYCIHFIKCRKCGKIDFGRTEEDLYLNDNKNIFYIYIYYDPVTNIPIYIGKGCGNRYLIHLSSKEKNKFNDHLISLKKLGVKPKIEFYKKDLSEQEAVNIKKELILKYGKVHDGTGSLYNLAETRGGGRLWKKN